MKKKSCKFIFITPLLIAALLIAGAACASAAAGKDSLGDGLEIGTWWYSCLGSIKFQGAGFDAQSNFEKDGGFFRNTNPVFKYDLKLNNLNTIIVQGVQAVNEGSLKLYGQNAVTINGTVFGTGTTADVKATARMVDADLLVARPLKLIRTPQNKLQTEWMAGLKFYRISLDLQDTASNSKNYYTKKLSIPQIGFRATYKMRENLGWFLSSSGSIWKEGSESERTYNVFCFDTGIDFELIEKNAEFKPPDNGIRWFVRAGYSEKYYEEKAGGNVTKFNHQGPQLKVKVTF